MKARRHQLLRVSTCILCAFALTYASYATVALLFAEQLAQQATLTAGKRAVEFDPLNAQYWIRYADLLDQAALPNQAALERAAQLNPLEPVVRIRLGLEAEGRGDYASAERELLSAATVSRLYEPRWTLANFYFRRGNSEAFWIWARRALELAPREPDALFGLCSDFSSDPIEIMERAVQEIPKVQND